MMKNYIKNLLIALILLISAASFSAASGLHGTSTLGRSLQHDRYNNHTYYNYNYYNRQYSGYNYGHYNHLYRSNRYNFEANRYRNPIHRAYQYRNGLSTQLHPISPLVNPNAGFIPYTYRPYSHRNGPGCR